MKTKLAVISIFVLTALCVSAQTVNANYDPAYDFSKVKSFYVDIGTAWGNPTNEEHAKQAVTRELTAKGWTPAPDPSTADVHVMIHGATATKHTIQEFYSGNAGGEDYNGMAVSSHEVSFKAGTAIIDIFDAKTKKLIFRGYGEDEVSDKPEKNRQKIDNGVAKMFKDFPPKTKG